MAELTTISASPPEGFSGLIFAPDAEVGVYLLMGLLWKYLPYRIAMESFELDPKREGHVHNKYLDAKAKVYLQREWKDVTMEFKLYSSGFRRDLAKHPGLRVGFLVCWIHDAPEIEAYVENVLELESIYRGLAKEDQEKIILDPDTVRPRPQSEASIDRVMGRFSQLNQRKIRVLVDVWRHVVPGHSELLFMHGASTIFRACAYSSEHLIIINPPPGISFKRIAAEFGGKEQQASVQIPLDAMTDGDLMKLEQMLSGNADHSTPNVIEPTR